MACELQSTILPLISFYKANHIPPREIIAI